jgi:hypothetical protein
MGRKMAIFHPGNPRHKLVVEKFQVAVISPGGRVMDPQRLFGGRNGLLLDDAVGAVWIDYR